MLEMLIQKDQAILKYLAPMKDSDEAILKKVKLVMTRFKIVKAELQELKDNL